MIWRALLAAAVLVCVGRGALATNLQLWIDPDGTTYLHNTAASPVWFDGYQIASENNRLNPAGWKSISDYLSGGQISEVIAALGPGALTFGEANPGPGNLAEVNLGGVGVLQPGAKFAIGRPFLDGPDSMADFFYQGGVLPEPSTWLLALLAAMSFFAMSRAKEVVKLCGLPLAGLKCLRPAADED